MLFAREGSVVLNNKIKVSKEFKEKIKCVSKIDNDACRYLFNVYTKHYLAESDNNIAEYLKKNRCAYQSNILDIVKLCKENKCAIFEITKIQDERCKKITIECERNNVPIIISENYEELYENVKSSKYNNVFLDINIDDITSWYNWNVVIENNLNNILEAFDKFSLEELQIDTIQKVEKCITQSEKGKYIQREGPFNIIKTIRLIDRLLGKNENNNCIITNIYSKGNINDYYIKELSELIGILTYRNLEDRYNYLYELLCNKLEVDIERYNYCIFINDKCIAQREKSKWPENEYDGCCYNVSKKEKCEYLNSKKSCDISCISCRLFTCRYLKDRGIDYDIRRNVIARTFTNIMQRPVFVWNFFTPKEKILKSVKKYNWLNRHGKC